MTEKHENYGCPSMAHKHEARQLMESEKPKTIVLDEADLRQLHWGHSVRQGNVVIQMVKA